MLPGSDFPTRWECDYAHSREDSIESNKRRYWVERLLPARRQRESHDLESGKAPRFPHAG